MEDSKPVSQKKALAGGKQDNYDLEYIISINTKILFWRNNYFSVQKFNCKSICYKAVLKNTFLIIWLVAQLAVTFAARSKKADF
jgi:hypothetical protein